MRHSGLKQYDPRPGVSISTLAYEYPAGHNVPEHAHDSDQLIYATRGVMEVSAGQRLWLTLLILAFGFPRERSTEFACHARFPCGRST